ncbi:MAG: lysophospholipid acyltransferase family protein [Gemmatimonadales bacterium]|nr:lysophospholipid acyltransferase family protein [Gemmatimonadales bacterium]
MPETGPARRGGALRVPILTANVPTRGNFLTRGIALTMLRLTGWRFDGEDFPDVKKCVLIVAPHTSNWDFGVGVMAMYALGLRGAFLAKDSLFKFPLGILMRWLGGSPVDRTAKSDVVTQTVELVQRSERIIVVLAPEGTRKLTTRWRSGFYWIAQKAGIPICPVTFDFSRKRITLFPLFHPTGDQDGDIARIRALYEPRMARYPEKFGS